MNRGRYIYASRPRKKGRRRSISPEAGRGGDVYDLMSSNACKEISLDIVFLFGAYRTLPCVLYTIYM